MKGRKVICYLSATMAVVLVLGALAYFFVFVPVSEMARDTTVDVTCSRVVASVNIFEAEQGRRPQSLAELESHQDPKDEAMVATFKGMHHNSWNDIYQFVPTTNGYAIIVAGPKPGLAGWFGGQRRTERQYEWRRHD